MSQENVEIIRPVYEARRHDASRLSDDPEVVLHGANGGIEEGTSTVGGEAGTQALDDDSETGNPTGAAGSLEADDRVVAWGMKIGVEQAAAWSWKAEIALVYGFKEGPSFGSCRMSQAEALEAVGLRSTAMSRENVKRVRRRLRGSTRENGPLPRFLHRTSSSLQCNGGCWAGSDSPGADQRFWTDVGRSRAPEFRLKIERWSAIAADQVFVISNQRDGQASDFGRRSPGEQGRTTFADGQARRDRVVPRPPGGPRSRGAVGARCSRRLLTRILRGRCRRRTWRSCERSRRASSAASMSRRSISMTRRSNGTPRGWRRATRKCGRLPRAPGGQNVLAGWLSAWSDLQFEIQDLVEAGDHVVLLIRDQRHWGRHSGIEGRWHRRGWSSRFAAARSFGAQLPRPGIRPRSRRASGVGDVAGERGDRAVGASRHITAVTSTGCWRTGALDAVLDWSNSYGLDARVFRGHNEIRVFMRRFIGSFESARAGLVGHPAEIDDGLVIADNVTYFGGRDGTRVQARSVWLATFRDGKQNFAHALPDEAGSPRSRRAIGVGRRRVRCAPLEGGSDPLIRGLRYTWLVLATGSAHPPGPRSSQGSWWSDSSALPRSEASAGAP